VGSTPRTLTALAAVAVVLAACSTTGNSGSGVSGGGSGSGSTTGVTASSVTVGQVDDLTIPVPGLFKGAEDGVRAYFAYVNSTGGVNGRKLLLDARDSAFQGGTVTQATGDQIKKDFALVGGFSLLDSAEQPLIDLAHMPDIGYPLSPQLAQDRNVYSPLPNADDDYPLGEMKYLAQAYPDAVKHVGILWAKATSATEASETAFENALKAAGFDIVYDRGFSPLESTFLPDVLQMKSLGVQMFISNQMPDSYAATLAKEMQQQDFHPINIEGAAYSNQLVSLAGSAGDGMYIAQSYALYLGQDAAAVPAVAVFDRWVKKADPSANFEIETLYGWASAELFTQALRAAGPAPTRAKLVQALGKITSFDADGLIPQENPAANVPGHCWLLAQIKGGKVVRVPPTPATGFVCSPTGYLTAPGWQPEQR
jgi:ABC-type branched-subunit amino acid transport system substrate-binding protein